MATDTLTGLDAAFLYLDSRSAPMNIGALTTFVPQQPIHPTRLVELLCARASRIPRLRQRVGTSWTPAPTLRWTDDPNFDVKWHVRAHHLPRPHQTDQLAEYVPMLMADQLDLNRPLWRVYVISGLPGGGFAILCKLHHALADGAAAVMLGLSLLDGFTPEEQPTATNREPLGLAGLAHSARRLISQPARLLGDSLATAKDLPAYVRQARDTANIAAAVLSKARVPEPASPLRAPTSSDRQLATLRLDLDDIRQVRLQHGGTANDVLLALLSGALRDWLADCGHTVDDLALRALIPVNQRGRSGRRDTNGNRLSGYLCDLPVNDSDPVRRLLAIRAAMDANKEAGPATGPGALPIIADRLPAAVHRLAMPFVGRGASLLFDLVVTNVPLPNIPLSLDGAELREIYPVVPLAAGHALGVAFCTYRGTVHIGLHANPNALPDVDLLGKAFTGTLNNLQEQCA